jgi:hypothetical protein
MSLNGKLEQAFWRNNLREIFDKWGHASRIESPATAAGFPDVSFCCNGLECIIELKAGTPDNLPEIRPMQVKWFNHRMKAGGRPIILTKIDRKDSGTFYIMIHEGSAIDNLYIATELTQWIGTSIKCWEWDKIHEDVLVYAISMLCGEGMSLEQRNTNPLTVSGERK